ncbi:winged helix-turn-helix domain-containing protein [Paraglaciecola sp. 2405UD69-4]|uniref:transcriptional regulator n=1 Tax=Paraglaciecola sp. 2405UD69-4 TaxID=3391836 RepID=UPI0039C942E9
MIYQFNNIEVDCVQFVIRVQGDPVAVEPKVFNLIAYLVQNRTRVISRDELFQQVWEGRLVSDTSLSNHINIARKVLKDSSEAQSVIKTVRSRGYQFVAEVQQLATDSDSTLHTNIPLDDNALVEQIHTQQPPVVSGNGKAKKLFLRKYWLVLLLFGAALAVALIWLLLPSQSHKSEYEEPYLLVVPFTLDRASVFAPLSDQISREVIQGLQQLPGLKTVPEPSAFAFRDNKRLSHIQNQIPDVSYLLDGDLKEEQNGSLELSVSLLEINTGELVWIRSFSLAPITSNWLSIQNQVTSTLVKSVSSSLVPTELRQVNKPIHYTPNSEAFELYVQGRYQLSLMTHDSVLRAIEYFNQAIALDLGF